MNVIDTLLDFFTARRMTIAEESMLTALRPGDRVVFSARSFRKRAIRRGDIVLVRVPDSAGRFDVKRVVGLPGETVEVRGTVVHVNGQLLDEPYLAEWARSDNSSDHFEVHLGHDEYAVLSDNRVHPGAVDSRRYGPVSRSRLLGVLDRRY